MDVKSSKANLIKQTLSSEIQTSATDVKATEVNKAAPITAPKVSDATEKAIKNEIRLSGSFRAANLKHQLDDQGGPLALKRSPSDSFRFTATFPSEKHRTFAQGLAKQFGSEFESLGVRLDPAMLEALVARIMDGGSQGVYTALAMSYALMHAASTTPPDPSRVANLLKPFAALPQKPQSEPAGFGFVYSTTPEDQLAADLFCRMVERSDFIQLDLPSLTSIVSPLSSLGWERAAGHEPAAIDFAHKKFAESLEYQMASSAGNLQKLNRLNMAFLALDKSIPLLVQGIGRNSQP